METTKQIVHSYIEQRVAKELYGSRYIQQMEQVALNDLGMRLVKELDVNHPYQLKLEHRVIEFDPYLRGVRHEYIITIEQLRTHNYYGA